MDALRKELQSLSRGVSPTKVRMDPQGVFVPPEEVKCCAQLLQKFVSAKSDNRRFKLLAPSGVLPMF